MLLRPLLQLTYTEWRWLSQGKVDPARRNYITIFSEMLEHKQVGAALRCGCQ